MKKAMIAMSGGVDSSVAAYLMKKEGFDCVGATMRLYRSPVFRQKNPRGCCSDQDEEDAAFVCYQLGIPHESVCFTKQFEEQVIRKFISDYESGLTPNPCIDCNRTMKFRALLEYAEEKGFDFVVTGHYARICSDERSGRLLLRKAIDESKDQSYVLYMLSQDQLAHVYFPLGDLHKTEVRRIGEENGLVNASKRESQDICFVPDGDYVKFMEEYTGRKYEEGDFLDTDGNKIGRHKGIVHYTIGQRKGLGISAPHPLYVAAIDAKKNTVTVAEKNDVLKQTVYAEKVNLIAVDELKDEMRIKARIRYNEKEKPASARMEGDRLVVRFDEPRSGVAVGQSVVLYDGDIVVGGGVICGSE